MPKYCYSRDEETFYGDFSTFEEAAAELDGEGGFVGEVIPATEYLTEKVGKGFAQGVVERADEFLYDELGGDDATITMDEATMEEFGKVIRDFLVAHGDFHRYGVKNVRRIEAG